jgi:hypothetical protein
LANLFPDVTTTPHALRVSAALREISSASELPPPADLFPLSVLPILAISLAFEIESGPEIV